MRFRTLAAAKSKRCNGEIDYAKIAVWSSLLVLIGDFLDFMLALREYQEQEDKK